LLAGLGPREEQQTCTPQKQTVTHRAILTTRTRTSLVRTPFLSCCVRFSPALLPSRRARQAPGEGGTRAAGTISEGRSRLRVSRGHPRGSFYTPALLVAFHSPLKIGPVMAILAWNSATWGKAIFGRIHRPSSFVCGCICFFFEIVPPPLVTRLENESYTRPPKTPEAANGTSA
jgi:hypothetical protein